MHAALAELEGSRTEDSPCQLDARLVQADAFIRSLPDGYDTDLAERDARRIASW